MHDTRISPANPALQPTGLGTSLGTSKPRFTPVRIMFVVALVAFIFGYAWWLAHDWYTQNHEGTATPSSVASHTNNQNSSALLQPSDAIAQLLSTTGIIAHDAYLMGTPTAAHAQLEAEKASRNLDGAITSDTSSEVADEQALSGQEIDLESQEVYDKILGADPSFSDIGSDPSSSSPDGSGTYIAPQYDSNGSIQYQPAPAASNITVQVIVSSSTIGNVVNAQTNATLPAGATALDALRVSGVSVVTRETQYGTYVVAIGGVSEKQYGGSSGWLYAVNGITPGYSASSYKIADGDLIEWFYTV